LTLSKRAFDNWYFEYGEAKRKFLDAKRNFEMKRRDIRLFVFGHYSKWCREKYGMVLRPRYGVIGGEDERPIDLFYADFNVSPVFRPLITRLLNQTFDEKTLEVLK
jgi:hypothetical protein